MVSLAMGCWGAVGWTMTDDRGCGQISQIKVMRGACACKSGRAGLSRWGEVALELAVAGFGGDEGGLVFGGLAAAHGQVERLGLLRGLRGDVELGGSSARGLLAEAPEEPCAESESAPGQRDMEVGELQVLVAAADGTGAQGAEADDAARMEGEQHGAAVAERPAEVGGVVAELLRRPVVGEGDGEENPLAVALAPAVGDGLAALEVVKEVIGELVVVGGGDEDAGLASPEERTEVIRGEFGCVLACPGGALLLGEEQAGAPERGQAAGVEEVVAAEGGVWDVAFEAVAEVVGRDGREDFRDGASEEDDALLPDEPEVGDEVRVGAVHAPDEGVGVLACGLGVGARVVEGEGERMARTAAVVEEDEAALEAAGGSVRGVVGVEEGVEEGAPDRLADGGVGDDEEVEVGVFAAEGSEGEGAVEIDAGEPWAEGVGESSGEVVEKSLGGAVAWREARIHGV